MTDTSIDVTPPPEPAVFNAAMATLHIRRKLFFLTVIAYMPLMGVVHKFSPNFRSMTIAFGCWFVALFTTALLAAVARCPRCGKYFHMHGMSLIYLRRCLHCQLHVTAKVP